MLSKEQLMLKLIFGRSKVQYFSYSFGLFYIAYQELNLEKNYPNYRQNNSPHLFD